MAYGLAFTGFTLFAYLIVGLIALIGGAIAKAAERRMKRAEACAEAKRRHPANRGRGKR